MSKCTHVIFVHGTFSSPQIWDQACHELSNDPTVKRVTCFKWSGANDQVERLTAANALAELVTECKIDRPEEEICLVGHSHGGNVCFHALDVLPNPLMISNIATMGTPFLWGTRRRIGAFIDAMYFLFATSLALLIPGVLIAVTGMLLMVTRNEYLLISSVLLLSVLMLPSFFWYLVNGENAVGDFVNSEHVRWGKLVAPQFNVQINSICFVVKGDEALVGLKALGHLSGVGTSLAVLHSEAVHIALNIVSNNSVILALGIFIFPPLFPSIFIMATLAICAYAVAVALQSIIRSHKYGFGDLGLWPLMLFEVQVRPLPPLIFPAQFKYIEPENSGLRHSSFYQDAVVIKELKKWISVGNHPNVTPAVSAQVYKLSRVLGVFYVILAALGIPLFGFIATMYYFRELISRFYSFF